MRLVRRVERLEGVQAAGQAEALAPERHVVWSEHDRRVDVAQLASGDLVAADVTFHPGRLGDEAWSQNPADYLAGGLYGWVVVSERVTRDESDLGQVFSDGVVIGQVVDMDGDSLVLEYDTGGLENLDLPKAGAKM